MGKESRKLVLNATSVICIILVTSLCTAFFASKNNQFEPWKHRLSNWIENANEGVKEEEPIEFLLRRLVRGEDRIKLETTGFSCHSDVHTEVCLAKKPVRINNNELTVHLPGSQAGVKGMIKPYARKEDQTAMERVTPVQILHGNSTDLPPCHFTHDVPALIFSSGGFTGNLFHEINEVIIPLFLTSRHFRSNLQFVITDYKPWWVSKYNRILLHLSRYQIINPEADRSVHCFPGAVIGLVYHDNLAINSTNIPGGYSMLDFKHFLRQSYNLKIKNVLEIEKPVLILISRRKSRRFFNEYEMVRMMKDLGFQVIVTRPYRMSNLERFASVLNSCSVMVGAHGAGLTNEVFLPDGAVIVQVVPLGLEWASANYYGGPAKKMGVTYLEYKIQPEESSLLDQYGHDHPAIVDPKSIFLEGYSAARGVYVDGQNLKINVTRFRKIMVEAKKLIGHSP